MSNLNGQELIGSFDIPKKSCVSLISLIYTLLGCPFFWLMFSCYFSLFSLSFILLFFSYLFSISTFPSLPSFFLFLLLLLFPFLFALGISLCSLFFSLSHSPLSAQKATLLSSLFCPRLNCLLSYILSPASSLFQLALLALIYKIKSSNIIS